MKKSDFYYDLPPDLIAQTPLERRDASRLLTLDKRTGATEHHVFHELPDFLNEGDCLVMNDSRVIPARLFGTRPTGGSVEVVLLRDLGGGHSIGIPLAVSARKSLIVPTASMTVHPVRMTGLVVGAPQTYQYFNQIQDQIVNFVTRNSHISREDFLRYMMATDEIATDVGTVLYGEEAVSSGLMDAIGSLSDALNLLHRQIDRQKKRGRG